MNYQLVSTKGTRTFSGTLEEAVEAATEMDRKLHPCFGVRIEDDAGNVIARVPEGLLNLSFPL